jgi:hypothetical protein
MRKGRKGKRKKKFTNELAKLFTDVRQFGYSSERTWKEISGNQFCNDDVKLGYNIQHPPTSTPTLAELKGTCVRSSSSRTQLLAFWVYFTLYSPGISFQGWNGFKKKNDDEYSGNFLLINQHTRKYIYPKLISRITWSCTGYLFRF